jgi:hypothetical protein
VTPEQKMQLYYTVENVKWRYKLDMFEDDALAEILKYTRQAKREILEQLNSTFAGEVWEMERNEALLAELDNLTIAVRQQVEADTAELSQIALEESVAANNRILSIDGAASNISFVQLSPEQIQSFLETAVGGAQISGWVNRAFDYPLQEKLREELGAGMFRGESYKKLHARISRLLDEVEDNINTLVRSWVQSANVAAQQTVAQSNSDVIKGWRWDATLENGNYARGRGTCLRCLALDARDEIYPLNGGPSIPLHPNCRCLRRYVTKSYRDMGIDIDELDDKVRPYTIRGKIDPVTGKVQRGATGTGGQPLIDAGRITGGMKEYFKKILPDELQRQTLGPRRYQLWKDGKIKLADLADKDGRQRTIKELMQL